MRQLDSEGVAVACRALGRRDPAMRRIYKALGAPPLWDRKAGFATLVHLILEQQVSLASAKATLDKLARACRGPITPRKLLNFDDDALKSFGFSRQKTRYCRILATSVQDGALDVGGLQVLDDADVHAALTALTGIGTWTANVYLLMVLRRPDVWPTGDIALQTAWQRLHALPARPSAEALADIATRWAPHRATAARLLWHYYLSGMPTLA
jgi:DNA-3-methyladenine glycosylase II